MMAAQQAMQEDSDAREDHGEVSQTRSSWLLQFYFDVLSDSARKKKISCWTSTNSHRDGIYGTVPLKRLCFWESLSHRTGLVPVIDHFKM